MWPSFWTFLGPEEEEFSKMSHSYAIWGKWLAQHHPVWPAERTSRDIWMFILCMFLPNHLDLLVSLISVKEVFCHRYIGLSANWELCSKIQNIHMIDCIQASTNLNRTQSGYLPLHCWNTILCTEHVFSKCCIDFTMVSMTVLTIIWGVKVMMNQLLT